GLRRAEKERGGDRASYRPSCCSDCSRGKTGNIVGGGGNIGAVDIPRFTKMKGPALRRAPRPPGKSSTMLLTVSRAREFSDPTRLSGAISSGGGRISAIGFRCLPAQAAVRFSTPE